LQGFIAGLDRSKPGCAEHPATAPRLRWQMAVSVPVRSAAAESVGQSDSWRSDHPSRFASKQTRTTVCSCLGLSDTYPSSDTDVRTQPA
jgi:hypothetical protein